MWELIDHHEPQIICGCETWLNPDILNNEVLPSSYKLHRKDRTDGYGGVLIGIKSNIVSDLIDSPSDLEVCTVLLHLSQSVSLLLFCVYRPPNTDIPYLANLCDYVNYYNSR